MQAVNTQDTIYKLRDSIRYAEEKLRQANDQRKRFEREVRDLRHERTQRIVLSRVNPLEGLRKQRHLNEVVAKLKAVKDQIKQLQIDVSYKKRNLDTLYSLESKIKHGDQHAMHQFQNLIWRI